MASTTSVFTQDSFWAYLSSRGIPEENILKMQQERIDCSVVGQIDDKTLADFIPAYGDRIAVRRFCMEKQRKCVTDPKKQSLFEKLKRKMETKTKTEPQSDEEHSLRPTHLRKNKRALKTTRKIEIGWLHNKKMVKKRYGGGTRVVEISKTATTKDILSHAKMLFFPDNESRQGKWEDFRHSIVDFQEAYLDEHVTVGDLYEMHKFGVLRFYLLTEATENLIQFEEEAEVASANDRLQQSTPDQMTLETLKDEQQPDTEQQQKSDHTQKDCITHLPPADLATVEIIDIDLESLDDTSEIVIGAMQSAGIVSFLDDTVPFEPIQRDEHPNNPQANVNTNTSTPIRSDAEPPLPPLSPERLMHVTVKLHRVNLLEELIIQFKDEAMVSYPIKFSFIDEIGADADGVSRDAYAAFWAEFLDCAAEGAEVRVPSLSPKWQEEEWRSVGRILAKGLKDHGYFPARLAQVFVAAVIFGEHSVSPELLFDSLMLYLSQSERDLLATALKETVAGDDEEEFLDLMDRMGVRTKVTQANLKSILLQVAHKQIIQQPKYALDNIAAVAGPTLREFFPSVLKLQKMYDDLKPTTRKVIKLLDASPANAAEAQSLRFLHQYIRGLDEIGLRKMLRFVTGSDVICVKKIEITFTNLEGFLRRLIAHTCGPNLELPSTYNSYPELRAEIEGILSSNYYSMDIA